MSAQLRAAFLRAILGTVLVFGVTYATAVTIVEDDCQARVQAPRRGCELGTDSREEKAIRPALAAGLVYLGARAVVEGVYDTRRQQAGNRQPADVTSEKNPAPLSPSDG